MFHEALLFIALLFALQSKVISKEYSEIFFSLNKSQVERQIVAISHLASWSSVRHLASGSSPDCAR